MYTFTQKKQRKQLIRKKQVETKFAIISCLRDGKLTPIHENITINELKEIEEEITKQGNKLY